MMMNSTESETRASKPRKRSDQYRNHRISVRVTQYELDAIKVRARQEDMKFCDYVVSCCLKRQRVK